MPSDDERWLDDFIQRMARPGPAEGAFFERRQRLGLGVGLDANGTLIYARDAKLSPNTGMKDNAEREDAPE